MVEKIDIIVVWISER